MAKSQRDKGKRIEREAVEILRPIFPDVRRRAMQSRGGGEGADLDGTPGWHIEVGGGKTVSPTAKWEQAAEDRCARCTCASPNASDFFHEERCPLGVQVTPIALTRRDRGTWLVTLSADAFTDLVRKARQRDEKGKVHLKDWKIEPGEARAFWEGEAVPRFAAMVLGTLDDAGAVNYVETQCRDKDDRRVVVTARRFEGKSPHQFREEAEAEVARLRAEIAALKAAS